MDERKAVARLKRGDVSGLETLVRLYQVQALEASYLVCHNYTLAEDVVQTAFLRAYERIGAFDEARPFGPWFLRSVINGTLTALTRRQAVSLEANGEEVALIPGPDPDLAARLEAAETREEVFQALDKLSPGQRAAIVMRYYLNWSDLEVSERLDLPPGTVRRRLHDARQRLRRLLPSEPS